MVKVEKSETFKDVQINTSNHPAERNLLHLTWDELETIVKQGQALLDTRNVDTHCGLTDSELTTLRNGEELYDLDDEIDY